MNTGTEVRLREETASGVSVLHAAPMDRFMDRLPTVFFFHNFMATKELSSFFGYLLAAAGLRVIIADLPMHGRRFDGNFALRARSFWSVLKDSIDEFPRISGHYISAGLCDEARVGVAGTSLGGFATLGCLVRYPWIAAGASYMGSGYFLDASRTIHPPCGTYDASTQADHDRLMAPLAAYQACGHLEALASRPLLVWHSRRDDIVPYGESLRLQADLTAAGLAGNLEILIDPEGGHRVAAGAADRGAAFFVRHLGKAHGEAWNN